MNNQKTPLIITVAAFLITLTLVIAFVGATISSAQAAGEPVHPTNGKCPQSHPYYYPKTGLCYKTKVRIA